jgi:DnaK suppressor protein
MALTRTERDELERALNERRKALESEVDADTAKSREDVFSETAGPVADPCDEATADAISTVEIAELSRDLNELTDINAALARLRESSYGLCIGCGGEIELERLRSQPAASRCFACQSVYERTFAQPSRSNL